VVLQANHSSQSDGFFIYKVIFLKTIPDATDKQNETIAALVDIIPYLDGTHTLRIAIDKFQTLDTVCIIEGKA
jgi:hypothetical protein